MHIDGLATDTGRLTPHSHFGYKVRVAIPDRHDWCLDRTTLQRRPGGHEMGWLQPMHMIVLLVAVSSTIALCGSISTAIARRKSRRSRASFAAGLICGFAAGAVLRSMRGRVRFLASVLTKRTSQLPPFSGLWREAGGFAVRFFSTR